MPDGCSLLKAERHHGRRAGVPRYRLLALRCMATAIVLNSSVFLEAIESPGGARALGQLPPPLPVRELPCQSGLQRLASRP